jgi:hypothetical protein
VPFVVYGLWAINEAGALVAASLKEIVRMSVANIPGGPLYEVAVGGTLAKPLRSVLIPDDLPFCLSMKLIDLGDRGEWRFRLEGTDPAEVFKIPPELQGQPPAPVAVEQLNQGAAEMVREATGLQPGEKIPEPAGPLPPSEQPAEPARFDPTRHMDLTTAGAPPPVPEPAAPGPPPSEAPQFSAPVPPPGRPLGKLDPTAEPFAH